MIQELNQSKISRRPKETALLLPKLVAETHTPLKEDAVKAVAAHKKNFYNHSNQFQGSLLELFNIELVEFVEQVGAKYLPVDWPTHATHQLKPTSWLKRTFESPFRLYAASVCAVPIKPRLKRTELKIHRPWPKHGPVYKLDVGGLEGKRNILRFLCIAMKADFPIKLIPKMNVGECDVLYRNLCRANKLFNS